MSYNNFNGDSYSDYKRTVTTDFKVLSEINSNEPVTLTETKTYLRVRNTLDDTLIMGMITTAREACERYLQRDILAKNREQTISVYTEPFKLLGSPVASITSIEADGITLLETNYDVNGLDNPVISFDVPQTKIKVTYATAGLTVDAVKLGILSYVNYLYRGRDGETTTNYKVFLAPYKTTAFYGTR